MSRILKSISFEPEYSLTLTTIECGAPLITNVKLDDSLIENPTSLLDQDEAVIPDPTSTNLLIEAQNHVEMMLSQAQIQMTTWQEEAHREGWEAGYTEAHQAIETELNQALISAQRLAEAAIIAYDQFLRDNQAELGRLAVAIAKKIIGKELVLNPKAITDIVATAIQVANIRGTCHIRINPKDYEIIEPYWNAVPSLQPPGRTWELVSDPRINQGGCLIETGGGTIDAQLETQLEQATLTL